MASNVRVILTKDVDKLGKAGDLVRVKPGYARNYLIPGLMAVDATSGNIARIEHERKGVLATLAKDKKTAEEAAEQLGQITLEIAKPVGEADRLYGSVTAREIAEMLKRKGVDIDRRKLELPGTIKQTGEFEITAKLGQGVSASFKLLVKKLEQGEPAA